MTYKRRKYHFGDTHLKKGWRVRNRKRDLDQIDGDLKPEAAALLLKQKLDVDKAGSGQFYCLHCARYFIDQQALDGHFRTKVHKRRLKALELQPYTVEDSERAKGHGQFLFPLKRKIETQKPHDSASSLSADPASSRETGLGEDEDGDARMTAPAKRAKTSS